MVLAKKESAIIKFLRNIGLRLEDLPFEPFPEKTVSKSLNVVTENVAGFDIPILSQWTPTEELVFTAINLASRKLYVGFNEINDDLAELLSFVRTADDTPLIPEEMSARDFITPSAKFAESEIYKQILRSQSYRQFKRDNRDLFDEQDSLFSELILREKITGRATAALFLATRIDRSWLERANELTEDQIKEIVKFIQKESGKAEETEAVEVEEFKKEAEPEKNDLKTKSKDGQPISGS